MEHSCEWAAKHKRLLFMPENRQFDYFIIISMILTVSHDSQADEQPDARGLLGRSRRPPLRGHTPAAPRCGLPVCWLPQTIAVRQNYDGPVQFGEDSMSIDVGEKVVVNRPSAPAK
jgi:hypothetical protein